MTARVARFKSSDKKPFFGSNAETGADTTNLSSGGKLENTLDITSKPELLFDSSRINPSGFNMDQVMLDYYPEYQMLKKLQTLTPNFTCNKCWKVLQFEKFFDDDHECLRDADVQQNQAPQDQIQSVEVEEFKGDPPDRALRLDDIYASDKESYFI